MRRVQRTAHRERTDLEVVVLDQRWEALVCAAAEARTVFRLDDVHSPEDHISLVLSKHALAEDVVHRQAVLLHLGQAPAGDAAVFHHGCFL